MYRGDMEREANTGEGVSDELMERDLDVRGGASRPACDAGRSIFAAVL